MSQLDALSFGNDIQTYLETEDGWIQTETLPVFGFYYDRTSDIPHIRLRVSKEPASSGGRSPPNRRGQRQRELAASWAGLKGRPERQSP